MFNKLELEHIEKLVMVAVCQVDGVLQDIECYPTADEKQLKIEQKELEVILEKVRKM